jgi:hypothetical protein
LLFNFALEYDIRRVQINQDGLKLNGSEQCLIYANDVNILGGTVHSMKNTVGLLVAGRMVNSDKTNYMVKSRDQHAGRSHNKKIDNSSFERVEEFKCLGTTLTNQNTIHE